MRVQALAGYMATFLGASINVGSHNLPLFIHPLSHPPALSSPHSLIHPLSHSSIHNPTHPTSIPLLYSHSLIRLSVPFDSTDSLPTIVGTPLILHVTFPPATSPRKEGTISPSEYSGSRAPSRFGGYEEPSVTGIETTTVGRQRFEEKHGILHIHIQRSSPRTRSLRGSRGGCSPRHQAPSVCVRLRHQCLCRCIVLVVQSLDRVQ